MSRLQQYIQSQPVLAPQYLRPVIRHSSLLQQFFFFSSRRRHTICYRDWSSDVCSSDLLNNTRIGALRLRQGDLAEGDRLLRESERILRSEPGPPIEILPTLDALALGARIRGNYDDAMHRLQEALDLLSQRPTAYMGSGGQLEIEL